MSFWILLYLAIPAFGANMVPVLAEKYHLFPQLNRSIDFGKTFRGYRIFGDHKTFRGFFVGILAAMLLSLLQFFLEKNALISFPYLSHILEFLEYGFLSGFGALCGDAVKSFFKRQIGIKSGRPFIPFDQIDYILGFLLLTTFLIPWELKGMLFLLIFAAIGNPLINFLSYVCGIKKTYW